MSVAELVFWTSVGVIVYVYAGYPLAVWFISRFTSRRDPVRPECWPSVTLVVAAYNEEAVIADKIRNSLSLDYSPGKLDILVVSDGSTDGTDAIVNGFSDRDVNLLRVEGRKGKTTAQNEAVRHAKGEILVFSDANAMYDSDAVKNLVRHFGSGDVGCVEGRRVDRSARRSAAGGSEVSYREWESLIKVWESRMGSCTGATGPIYAVRRDLYIPLRREMISDLMEPMLIVREHGKRHVFEPEARSRELVNDDMGREFRRKVRIMTRCLNSLLMRPDVLNPFRAGWFAVQVISHRVLRWLVPLFVAVAFVANVLLLPHPLYRVTLLLQVTFLLVAAVGAAMDRLNVGPAFLRLPHYFCVANLAALVAIRNCLGGRNIVTWQTERV